MKSIVTKAMCHSGERSLQRCRGILFSLSISSKWMLLRIRISGRLHTTIDNSLLLETCVLIRKISPRTLIYKKKKHDEYPVIYTQPHWTSGSEERRLQNLLVHFVRSCCSLFTFYYDAYRNVHVSSRKEHLPSGIKRFE